MLSEHLLWGAKWSAVSLAVTGAIVKSGLAYYCGRRVLSLIFCVVLKASKAGDRGVRAKESVQPAAVSSDNAQRSLECKQRGIASWQGGNCDESLQWFSEALRHNYNDPELYALRSEVLHFVGRYSDAWCDGETCVLLAPLVCVGYLRKGLACIALNKCFDAFYNFTAAIQVCSNSDPLAGQVREELARLNLTHRHICAGLKMAWVPGMSDTLNVLRDSPEKFHEYFNNSKTAMVHTAAVLVKNLEMDVTAVGLIPRVAEAYFDKSTYICGLVLSLAPAEAATLGEYDALLRGVSHVVRQGWKLGHAFAKFAACSLVNVAISEDLGHLPQLRAAATRELLWGMSAWLCDPSPRPFVPEHELVQYEVCGCFYLTARHSATTWIEVLFQKPKAWVVEEFLAFPDRDVLLMRLVAVVRDEGVVPLCVTRMLSIPAIAEAVMLSDLHVNMHLRRKESIPIEDEEGHTLEAPACVFGDWLLLALGYLYLQHEDSELVAAVSARALCVMAKAVPDGVERLSRLWISLPLMKALASTASHCADSLALLEVLARSGAATIAAMTSLGEMYCGASAHATTPSVSPSSLSSDFPPLLPVHARYYHALHTWLPSAEGGILTLASFGGRPRAHWVLVTVGDRAAQGLPASWTSSLPSKDAEDGRADRPLFEGRVVPCGADTAWLGEGRAADEESCNEEELAGCVALVPASLCLWPEPNDPEESKASSHYIDLTFRAAAARCARRGATGVVFYNDGSAEEGCAGGLPYSVGDTTRLRVDGQVSSRSPAAPSVMVSGYDGAQMLAAASSQDLRDEEGPTCVAAAAAPDAFPPTAAFPLPLRLETDLAKAWGLLEVVCRADPTEERAASLASLVDRMTVPDKCTWLTRRLRRRHAHAALHAEQNRVEASFAPQPAAWDAQDEIVFMECDRTAGREAQLEWLHTQFRDGTGLGSEYAASGELEVRFKDESSVGSAVVREALEFISKVVYRDEANHLLMPCDAASEYWMPNPAALFSNPHWKQEYELLGKLLGLALWHRVTLELPLHPYVWELILSVGGEEEEKEEEKRGDVASAIQSDLAVLRRINASFCEDKVEWLLRNDVEALGFDFPMLDALMHPAQAADADSGSESGAPVPPPPTPPPPPRVLTAGDMLAGTAAAETPQLAFGHADFCLDPAAGQGVAEDDVACVTNDNKEAYVATLLDWRLRGGLRQQVQAIRTGLRVIVPDDVVTELRPVIDTTSVGQIVSGEPTLDVDDWQANAKHYGGIDEASPEVVWFWMILRKWKEEDDATPRLVNLLQFTTGSRRVPVGGFRYLVGANGGLHRFTLSKGHHLTADSLPSSHACICTLDLPPFASFEAALKKLEQVTEAEVAFHERDTD